MGHVILGEAQGRGALEATESGGVGREGEGGILRTSLWPKPKSALTWGLESGLPLLAWEQLSPEAQAASLHLEGYVAVGGPLDGQARRTRQVDMLLAGPAQDTPADFTADCPLPLRTSTWLVPFPQVQRPGLVLWRLPRLQLVPTDTQ